MKIKTIGYGRVIPDNNYGNEKYYVEAELEDWEDPAASLETLREWVSTQHYSTLEINNLAERRAELRGAISAIEHKIAKFAGLWNKVEGRWNEAVTFLEKHGLQTTETLPARPRFEELIGKNEVAAAIAEVEQIPF